MTKKTNASNLNFKNLKNSFLAVSFLVLIFSGCSTPKIEGSWDFQFSIENEPITGVLKIENTNGVPVGHLNSYQLGKIELQNLKVSQNRLSAEFEKWEVLMLLKGTFTNSAFKGTLAFEDKQLPFEAVKQSIDFVAIDRSAVPYILSDNDVREKENNIDHASIIEDLGEASFERGRRIYNSNCINCHGNQEIEGSIPLSLKFWEQPFKAGADPFSMYQTVTKGLLTMPPQLTLTPQEKYDVISFIREEFVKKKNPSNYFKIS